MLLLQALVRLRIPLVIRARLTLDLLHTLPGDDRLHRRRGRGMRAEGFSAVRTEVSQANHLNCLQPCSGSQSPSSLSC